MEVAGDFFRGEHGGRVVLPLRAGGHDVDEADAEDGEACEATNSETVGYASATVVTNQDNGSVGNGGFELSLEVGEDGVADTEFVHVF